MDGGGGHTADLMGVWAGRRCQGSGGGGGGGGGGGDGGGDGGGSVYTVQQYQLCTSMKCINTYIKKYTHKKKVLLVYTYNE